jgi:hypothetical protein
MKCFKYFSWLLVLAMFTACASRGPNHKSDDENDWTDLHRSGADPTTHASLETVNLIELLDPKGKVAEDYTERARHLPSAKSWDHLSYAVRYDLIFAQFAQLTAISSTKQHRNLVQNRLLAASERRCGRFFQYLKRDNSNKNFWFATFSSVFATAGALVPGLRAAQNLSGISALGTGLRAEYNNEFYANLAVSVITRGIEEKRNVLRAKLNASQHIPYDNYDIAAAVTDAVQFDSSCNIVNGLELANEAIQRFNEPGLDAINRTLLKGKLTRALSSEDSTALQKYSTSMEGINIQSLLNGFNGNAIRTSYPTGYPDYLIDATQPGAMSSLAAQTHDSLRRYFAQLQSDATSKINATSSLSTATAATLTASVTAVVNSLSVAVSSNFSGTDTASCFTEAQSIAIKLATAHTELQFAQSKAQGVAQAQVHLDDQLVIANLFLQKLRHYEHVGNNFKRQLLDKLTKDLEQPKPQADSIYSDIKTNWVANELLKGIGTQRACKAPA